ncbi:MAG: peptide-methionine (S)-S-oxide reductase MsrA [Verrucomicrobia bacterium]|nr:peptide-methionine (S)-S-oxide reductase MsrA [Verrucomicrobiota bacterium]MBI3870990.1 peptide-methionine (S)-S-oxide reductase MsrA [Verrucomicrobiota bacterium]
MNAADSPAPSSPKPTSSATQRATFGGGCFWCLEALFELQDGVVSVTSGYAGGSTPKPTYEQVCTGATGHAEVVQVEFDPAKTSYETLLGVFWRAHNPTTPNRQGADEGTQYRSIILCHDAAQTLAAEKSKREAQPRFHDPIVTEIATLTQFYAAEDYHQDYFRKNPSKAYCRAVIQPKVDKFKKEKAAR